MSEKYRPESDRIAGIGYRPLNVRRDGKDILLPDDTLVEATIPVGPEEHHLRLFVAYESVFGRGNAKVITHTDGDETESGKKQYGAGYLDEYRELADDYDEAARGSPEEVATYIGRLEAYCNAHPALYEDATLRRTKRIRIVTKSDVKDTMNGGN